MPGHVFPLKIAPSHGAIWAINLIHGSLGSRESKSQTASRSVQLFCAAHGRESLYFTTGRSFPIKIALSHGDLDPDGWLRSTVVERRSLAGELSLSCARPAADG